MHNSLNKEGDWAQSFDSIISVEWSRKSRFKRSGYYMSYLVYQNNLLILLIQCIYEFHVILLYGINQLV